MAEPNGGEQSAENPRAKLADLTARAATKDAIKDFESAAELYSQATELQAELNGELSSDNADLLFAYGKALYNVAVSKSDALGTKAAEESISMQPAYALGRNGATTAAVSSSGTALGSELHKNAISTATGENEATGKESNTNQPYFQFAGDENFDDSDSGEDDGNAGQADGAQEIEEDDFANAFEVLDVARVLYSRKLEAARKDQGNGKSTSPLPETKQVEERLADTYDLQAEISLEAERFADAVSDLRTALEMKQSLYPLEDPSVAECHYKLSLALEFSSVNKPHDGSAHEGETTTTKVDEGMREEAVYHMEKAIESCKIRAAQEQRKVDNGDIAGEDKMTAAKKRITNVKEIIVDMEQRVSGRPFSPLFCLAYS